MVETPAPQEPIHSKGGRPAAPSTMEGMVMHEFKQQVSQNNQLRALSTQVIKNIKALITSKADDMSAQVEASDAIVQLLNASTRMIETLAKHITGLRQMQTDNGPDMPSEILDLLGRGGKDKRYGTSKK